MDVLEEKEGISIRCQRIYVIYSVSRMQSNTPGGRLYCDWLEAMLMTCYLIWERRMESRGGEEDTVNTPSPTCCTGRYYRTRHLAECSPGKVVAGAGPDGDVLGTDAYITRERIAFNAGFSQSYTAALVIDSNLKPSEKILEN